MSFFEHFRAFSERVRCSELYTIVFIFIVLILLHEQFATQGSSLAGQTPFKLLQHPARPSGTSPSTSGPRDLAAHVAGTSLAPVCKGVRHAGGFHPGVH